jgi:hypothetical protein
MVIRDFNIEITENMRRRFIEKKEPNEVSKKKRKKKIELERILMIGPKQIQGCHFSEKLYDVAVEEGFDVQYVCPQDLKDDNWEFYISKERHYNIAQILRKLNGWKPQLIIVDECGFYWDNFTGIPIFYQHREFKRQPSVFHPTIAFFWHQGIINYYKKMFMPNWMAQVASKQVLYIAVDPNMHQPEKKEYKGVSGIGYREDLGNMNIPEYSNVADIELLCLEEEQFKETGLRYFDTPVTDQKYRETLPKCEALWIPLSIRQYTTRRMLEAMICKTLCIIKIENEEHEKVLEDMGYKNGEHYIGINEIKEIKEMYKFPNNKEEIIENAYQVTLENHTYKNRLDQIVKIYEELKM